MNGILGDLFPLAVVVAISPLSIIAAIVLSERAKLKSVAFLLGWTVGILLAVIVFAELAQLIPGPHVGPRPIAGVIRIVLGVALLVLGARRWKQQPPDGTEPTTPRWLQGVQGAPALRAAGLAFVLVFANPKNVVMAATAGLLIGVGQLDAAQASIAIAVFVFVAIITVAIPVVGSLILGERTRPGLSRMSAWLTRFNAPVTIILLVLLGVMNIGRGLGNF